MDEAAGNSESAAVNGAAIGGAIGGVGVVLLVALVGGFLYWRRGKRGEGGEEAEIQLRDTARQTDRSQEQLAALKHDFSGLDVQHKLGGGSFGTCFFPSPSQGKFISGFGMAHRQRQTLLA